MIVEIRSAGCTQRNFCLPKIHLLALIAKLRKILVTTIQTLQISESHKGPFLLSSMWHESSTTAKGFVQQVCRNGIQAEEHGCKAWA